MVGFVGNKWFFDDAAYEIGTLPIVAPAPTGGGNIKVWNGTSWVAKPVKVWNGTSWVAKPMKFWSGLTWTTTAY